MSGSSDRDSSSSVYEEISFSDDEGFSHAYVFPTPSSGSQNCASADFLKLGHHPVWYAPCHHNICYPADCKTCHGVPTTTNLFILPATNTRMVEGNVNRESQVAIRAEKLKRDELLSKQPVVDHLPMIPLSEDSEMAVANSSKAAKVTTMISAAPTSSSASLKTNLPLTRGRKRAIEESESNDGGSTVGSKITRIEKFILEEFTQVKSMVLEVENKADETVKMKDTEIVRLQALLKSKDEELESTRVELKRKNDELQHAIFTHSEALQQKAQEFEDRLQKMCSIGFDNGAFHVIRCMRAYDNHHTSIDDLVLWLATPQNDPTLLKYHPEIPYREELLEDFQKKHVKHKPPIIWEPPPPLKEYNLQDAVKKVDDDSLKDKMGVNVVEGIGHVVDEVGDSVTKGAASVPNVNAFGVFAPKFGVVSSPTAFGVAATGPQFRVVSGTTAFGAAATGPEIPNLFEKTV